MKGKSTQRYQNPYMEKLNQVIEQVKRTKEWVTLGIASVSVPPNSELALELVIAPPRNDDEEPRAMLRLRTPRFRNAMVFPAWDYVEALSELVKLVNEVDPRKIEAIKSVLPQGRRTAKVYDW